MGIIALFISFLIVNTTTLFCQGNNLSIGEGKDTATGDTDIVIICPYDDVYEYHHPVQLYTHITA